MKLRVARKIMNTDLARYRDDTLGRCHRRYAKCASAKDEEAYYQYLLRLQRKHSSPVSLAERSDG